MIRCAGEMDLSTLDPLRELVERELEDGRPRLVFDLEETRFLDSTAISLLLATLRRCRQADGDVLLAGATPRVRQILAITRLTGLFRTFPTVREALAAL